LQSQLSLAERLAQNPALRAEFFAGLSEEEAFALQYDWKFWGRPKQQEPSGDWWYWVILAGRGFGKSRTGGQWINARVESGNCGRIALVGETVADVRDIMVEGPSGVLACSPPWNKARYAPSNRRVTWANGAVATTYSAETPDQLRGPEHDSAWCDELAKWKHRDAWDQLLFGMRRPGVVPRVLVTTTPRPTPIIKELVKDPLTRLTRGSTYENQTNLSPVFLQKIKEKYAGTRLGRQELDAEVLDDAPGALWKRDDIEADRVHATPEMRRIVVAIDPSVSAESSTSETGIVAVGLGKDGHGYVLSDGSIERPTPEQWAKGAVALYNTLHADRIIGEVNNGGDLVQSNVDAVQKNLPFKMVRASRGKHVRAEPISSFYEQHRVHHVGMFPLLEDQMCQWEPGVSTWSPNRVDALVWALTELMLGPEIDTGHAVTKVATGRGMSRGW